MAFADSVSNLAEAREVQLQLYATQTNSSQRDALIESLQVTAGLPHLPSSLRRVLRRTLAGLISLAKPRFGTLA